MLRLSTVAFLYKLISSLSRYQPTCYLLINLAFILTQPNIITSIQTARTPEDPSQAPRYHQRTGGPSINTAYMPISHALGAPPPFHNCLRNHLALSRRLTHRKLPLSRQALWGGGSRHSPAPTPPQNFTNPKRQKKNKITSRLSGPIAEA
jgi:hypothetical protein